MRELRDYHDQSSLEFASMCIMEYQKGMTKPSMIRKNWIKKMMKKGLNGYVAYDGDIPAGFFEFCPIEIAPDRVSGKNLTFIVCGMVHLWNTPSKKRYTGQGIGRLLIEKIEEVVSRKSKGVVAWGFDWDNWFMPAAFFLHLGYEEVGRDKNRLLLWKLFKRRVAKPKLVKKRFKFKPMKTKVIIDILASEQCPFFINLVDKWHKVVKEMGDKYVIQVHPLKSNKDFCKLGSGMAIYVNGKSVPLGPMADERIRDILIKEGE